VTTGGAQPSQKKRITAQVEETRKNMKYTKEGPVITLTEDDVKFVADKVQERGNMWSTLQKNKKKRSWPNS
jgi:hypothetical protein